MIDSDTKLELAQLLRDLDRFLTLYQRDTLGHDGHSRATMLRHRIARGIRKVDPQAPSAAQAFQRNTSKG